MKNALILTFFLSIFSTSSVFANTTWEVVPGPSSIEFKVQHMMFSAVEGKFKRIEGTVIANGESLENAQMEARIPVQSIYTGIEDRDEHLRSKDFFFTEEYPDISFKSKSVTKTGLDTYRIDGELTMRGITKPVTLTAKCAQATTLKNGKVRMYLKASGQVSRYDYGLKWNELMETGKALVGEQVDIDLKIALLKSDTTG